ncbi:hypothetical protein ACFXAZ_21140, partial [Streptomyces sp. NPDC059477]|uniref:hypothetical protein n=1 Tax=Streptomyces sp. NPDC059477 TaxID=3346847 RepID=UPI0036A7BCA1
MASSALDSAPDPLGGAGRAEATARMSADPPSTTAASGVNRRGLLNGPAGRSRREDGRDMGRRGPARVRA